MRRSILIRGIVLVGALGAAGMLAAVGLGSGASHGQQRWSGQWDFVHDSGVTGGFAFRHETDENGATLLQQIGGTPCPEPTDYFAGGYTVPDGTPPSGPPPGEFVDTGKIRACVVDGNPLHVRGRYESNHSGGDRGDIDLTLDASGTSWTGTFTIDGAPGTFGWRGTFDKHFEDGADDPSTPPYGSGTSPETPPAEEPPASCPRLPQSGSSGDEEAPRCLYDVSFRVKVNGEPTSGPRSLDLATSALAGAGTFALESSAGRLTILNEDTHGTIRHGDRYVIADDERLRLTVQQATVYGPGVATLAVQVVASDDPGCKVGEVGRLILHDAGDRDRARLLICGRNHLHGWVNRPRKDVFVAVQIKVSPQ